MAIDMLNARLSGTKGSPEETREAENRDTVAVVPLAIPLVAGPAAMSTVILYAHQSPSWTHRLVVCFIAGVVASVTWLALRMASMIGRWLGKTGVNIASRIMGLLLAAVAVEFIADGAAALFPGLMRGP
jgi:multiple antibiotic resistance protein